MPVAGNRRVFGGGTGARGIKFQPDASCVLWLPGQDDAYSSTIRDRSGKGNHGTLTGTTWTRLSTGIWSSKFNGTTNYINCTNAASLNLTAAWTIGGWFNSNSLTAEQDIIARRNAAGAGPYTLEICDPDGGITVAWNNGGWRITATAGSLYTTGKWYFLIATWDGTYVKIYLNGALVKTSADLSATPPTSNATEPTLIGARILGTIQAPMNGSLDLIRVHNTALAASTIANNYNQERSLFGV
jgi:hypothetical protein